MFNPTLQIKSEFFSKLHLLTKNDPPEERSFRK